MKVPGRDAVVHTLTGALGSLWRVVVAVAAAGLLTVILILLVHGNVRLALWSLWDGAFGTPYKLGNTLVAATPLLLTGMGVAIAFRAKMWNIGGEGQFLVGALAASAIAESCAWTRGLGPWVLIPLVLLTSAAAGALWALIAGWLRTARSVPEVISTIMLNFIASELLSYLVNGSMQRSDHSQPSTQPIGDSATLPTLSGLLPNLLAPSPLHVGCLVALAALAVAAVFLDWTPAGFALKLVGANPHAARLSGVPIAGTLLLAMLWSGAFCGLAGGIELTGRVGFVPEGYAPGYGFQAVAVALLGRLSPLGVLLSALFFGALSVGCDNMERTAGIAHEMGLTIQAVSLLVLLIAQWPGWILPRRRIVSG